MAKILSQKIKNFWDNKLEYTGPADSRDSAQPSTFKVARETLITAQRLLLDTGNLNVFHQSIGSLTLLDDYRRWRNTDCAAIV